MNYLPSAHVPCFLVDVQCLYWPKTLMMSFYSDK